MENIIIDTDLGFDCDDAGAIAVANILKNKNKIDVLAITHSVNRLIGGSAVKCINEFYGNPNIPIGVADKYAIDVDNFYNEFYAKFHYKDSFNGWCEIPSFYKLFNGLNLDGNIKLESSIKTITKSLINADDKSVTFVCIGQLNNLASILMDANAKNIFFKKVKKIVIMCGNFLQDSEEFLLGDMYWKGEFNVLLDVESARYVFDSINIPVYVLDFNQGCNVLSGEPLSLWEDNPVHIMYKNHSNGKNYNLPSWDILAVMFASDCFNDCFSVTDNGEIYIEDGGRSVFSTNKQCNHYLIKVEKNNSEMGLLINKLLLGKF